MTEAESRSLEVFDRVELIISLYERRRGQVTASTFTHLFVFWDDGEAATYPHSDPPLIYKISKRSAYLGEPEFVCGGVL